MRTSMQITRGVITAFNGFFCFFNFLIIFVSRGEREGGELKARVDEGKK